MIYFTKYTLILIIPYSALWPSNSKRHTSYLRNAPDCVLTEKYQKGGLFKEAIIEQLTQVLQMQKNYYLFHNESINNESISLVKQSHYNLLNHPLPRMKNLFSLL